MTIDPEKFLAQLNALDNTPQVREDFVRGPLNYTGSKKDSLEKILEILPIRDVWCDVFGGSGIVSLARQDSPLEIFNDRHSGITAFYRAVKHNLDELIGQIELMPHSREMFLYAKTQCDSDSDVIRGAKWYYLVQSSFVGRAQYFGRVLKGKSNIWKKIQENLELFPWVHTRVREWQIENLDWRTMFKDFDSPETVWYLDPPYWGSNVYEHQMTKTEHIELCTRIFNLEGFVALSGYDNEVYNTFDWDGKHVFEVESNVATLATADTTHQKGGVERESRFECLWIKEAYE